MQRTRLWLPETDRKAASSTESAAMAEGTDREHWGAGGLNPQNRGSRAFRGIHVTGSPHPGQGRTVPACGQRKSTRTLKRVVPRTRICFAPVYMYVYIGAIYVLAISSALVRKGGIAGINARNRGFAHKHRAEARDRDEAERS